MKKKKKKTLKTLVVLILLSVMAFSGWKIWSIESAYKKSGDAYTEAAGYVTIPDKEEKKAGETAAPTAAPASLSEEEEAAEEEQIDWPEVDFDALLEINSDIVGWIYVEDTEINYPITESTDNVYYAYHMWNKVYDGFGCIFMDFRNSRDFSDPNSVIYGHHMQNGTMFHNLHGYKEQEFYENHKTAYLLTPEKNYRFVIFAAYVANPNSDAWKIDFSREEFEPWYRKAVENSCIETGIVPTPEDRIVTLSTCSYEYEGARFVVLGILK